MIAVRMYVTGHCQSEIESAVRQCAPAIRTPEQAEKHHNWDDYAQRTARYAFSVKAERDVENHWNVPAAMGGAGRAQD